MWLNLDSVEYLQGGPKNGYPVLFWDNFGNSAPILTVLSLLQEEIYDARKREVLPPTAPLLCDRIT